MELPQGGGDGRSPVGFSSSVTGWFSSPDQGVVFAVDRVFGVPEVSRNLSAHAPCAVEVLGSVVEGRRWWAELALRGDHEPETCLTSVTLDGEDRVSEVVWLRAPIVPRGAGGSGPSSEDARQILDAYFGDLQASHFGNAASWFAPDGIYSHPPYRPGADRVLWHGREAIRDGFINERGESPVRQIITDDAQDGSRAFIRGVVEGVPHGAGGTFMSTAELSESGEIARYVAFYSAVRF